MCCCNCAVINAFHHVTRDVVLSPAPIFWSLWSTCSCFQRSTYDLRNLNVMTDQQRKTFSDVIIIIFDEFGENARKEQILESVTIDLKP